MASPKAPTPAGWYPHPQMADTIRYWSGSEWTSHIAPSERSTVAPPPESAVGYILAGFLLSVVGGAFLFAALNSDSGGSLIAFIAYVVISIGAIMTTAGVIAIGVRIGVQRAHYNMQR